MSTSNNNNNPITTILQYTNEQLNQTHIHELSFYSNTPIIDCHHHLFSWEITRPRSIQHVNTMGKIAHLYQYQVQDYLLDSQQHHIYATVYTEVSSPNPLEEITQIYNNVTLLAASTTTTHLTANNDNHPSRIKLCHGIISRIDLLSPNLENDIKAHQAILGNRLCGFRFKMSIHPDLLNTMPKGIAMDNLIPGIKQYTTTSNGLPLDVWCYHTQLDDLYQLIKSCHDCKFVLNHCGSPILFNNSTQQNIIFQTWYNSMKQLSSLPNLVMVKIGGLCMNYALGQHISTMTNNGTLSSFELAQLLEPWIVSIIQLFGAERCCFESNWPMDKSNISFDVLWNAYKRVMSSKYWTSEQRRQLFFQTANQVYKLGFDMPRLDEYCWS
jgi:L-fuconolactonase